MKLSGRNEKILKSIYYDPADSASYGSFEKLYISAKEKIPQIKRKDVKHWLESQLTYTLHKPVRRAIKRNPVIVSYIDEQWQADLVDMLEFKKENDGFSFILTVIDLFSKYAWAVPIKSKSGMNICEAFTKIFQKRLPSKLQTDQGREFKNKYCSNLFEEKGILFFTTRNNDTKCSLVERFNRTLKSKMFKYFTSKGTRRYINVLQQLVHSYNNCYHRSIKMRPVDVNDENENLIFKNLYGYDTYRDLLKSRQIEPKLKVNDNVRRTYEKKVFDKSYYPNWTDSIYTVTKVIKGYKNPTYEIESENGQKLDKKFYREQLQKVSKNLFRVEKILKHRTRNRVKEYFVKWLNHPNSDNTWISSKNLIKL